MPRFFFNVTSLPPDEDGAQLESAVPVRREALRMFGEMIRERASDLRCPFEMEVSDERGEVLVRFILTDG